jgi:DNA repair photolyase
MNAIDSSSGAEPFRDLHQRVKGHDIPSTITRGTSNASIYHVGRGFMDGFDCTWQFAVGCPAACLFCYVSETFGMAPRDVRENWGFDVRHKQNVTQRLRTLLDQGSFADKTVYWSGVTDPYASPRGVTADVWRVLIDTPVSLRPKRIAVQTRFRPDRDAALLREYATTMTSGDGGPPVLVSYSIGSDRNDLIRAWERATPSFESRIQAIEKLRAAEVFVVATLSPFGLWRDLPAALEAFETLGVAYLTVLFFKQGKVGAKTSRGFIEYLRDEFPQVLDPCWQKGHVDIMQDVYGVRRVLVGKPGFASLARPQFVL